MEYSFIKKEGNDRLLLCVLGWASGPETLKNFDIEGFDILAVYDYRNTVYPEGVKDIANSYPQLWILGWSFGVYMAEKLSCVLKKPVMSLAVNGTSFPCDDKYGIPPRSLELTVRSVESAGTGKFYRRMCGGDTTGFTPTVRDLAELAEELRVLSRTFGENPNTVEMWSNALIGSGDVIFPFANMKRFWEEHSTQTSLTVADIPHYPFSEEGIKIIRDLIGWKVRNL